MRKGIFVTVLLAGIFAGNICFAENNIGKITIESSNVLVSGVCDEKNADISMIITPKGAEKAIDSIVMIKEDISDENGAFNIDFRADKEQGIWKDGFYTIYLKINNSEELTEDFYYYSQEGKRDIIEEFINNKDKRPEMLGEDTPSYNIFLSLGIQVGALSESGKAEFLAMLDEELSTDEKLFKEGMNRGIAALLINKGTDKDIGNILAYTDDTYIENEWIESAVFSGRPYSGAGVFGEAYREICVLYNMKDARYNEILEMITENAELLGIDKSDKYSSFKAMSGTKKGSVCEKLAEKMKNGGVDSAEKFYSEFENAVEEAANKYSQGGGGSSGGGGGASKNPSVQSGVAAGMSGTPSLSNEENKTNPFCDIESIPWAEEAILKLYADGVIAGVGEGRFEPNRAVRREEFVTMLVKAAGTVSGTEKINFSDVSEKSWYYNAVKDAYSAGIVSGISDDKFGTGLLITREDMAVMAEKACLSDISEIKAEPKFSDADEISDYARNAVSELYKGGVISGMEDGSFRPRAVTTRAQAAVLLYKLFGE